MTEFPKSLPSSLTGIQGPTPYDHDEIIELRRRAWTEQGLFIAAPHDRRLSRQDREHLIRIAELLYGEGVKS